VNVSSESYRFQQRAHLLSAAFQLLVEHLISGNYS